MTVHPFNLNILTAFGAIAVGLLVLTMGFGLTHIGRRKWLQPLLEKECVAAWQDAAVDGENDMIAIGIGFLFGQVLRFAIHGKLPPIDPVPVYHKQWEASLLLGCAVALVLCTIACSKARVLAERSKRWG